MNKTSEQLKEQITSLFDKSKYQEYADIDPGIQDIMKEINSYPNIMTTHSCEGHEKKNKLGDDVTSGPYFSFIVNELGWDMFWRKVVPVLSLNPELTRVGVNIYTKGDKDYSALTVHGPHLELSVHKYKEKFWKSIKWAFKEMK